MGARLRVLIVAVLTIGGVTALVCAGYRFNWSWTGFGPETSEPRQHAKTLWDWLNLVGVLAIPAVVGLGAAWYTAQQGRVSDRENTDNQRETALQAYIDKMSDLLLHEKLRDSKEEDEVRKIARVRTLTILPRLDADRKSTVVKFLYESGLIERGSRILSLFGADLRGINFQTTHRLSGRSANLSPQGAIFSSWKTTYTFTSANLSGVDLSGADLSGANLSHADLKQALLSSAQLIRADLSGAKLNGADLRGTKLAEADLREADLREADLRGADFQHADLRGARLNEGDLSDADLRDAGVDDVDLSRADLSSGQFFGGLDDAAIEEAEAEEDGSEAPLKRVTGFVTGPDRRVRFVWNKWIDSQGNVVPNA